MIGMSHNKFFSGNHKSCKRGFHIGSATARLCQAVGMSVIGLSRNPQRPPPAGFDQVLDLDSQAHEGLAAADHLVLALPLCAATRALIGRQQLALLKPGASIVNLARPQIVDENALLDALRDGALGAAYVSGLEDVSRLRRHRAARQHNLIVTHYSDAHLRKKNRLAFAQFR